MPAIKILTGIAGFREGRDFTWNEGDVVDVDQATANGYVSCGFAELARAKPGPKPKADKVERAIVTPAETPEAPVAAPVEVATETPAAE